mmetsp:Transcript_2972/g.8569  ORF Transcript_2972/g.8569 Transcript_2972/m.8569 type:complete len:207 (+) Transcript_2972:635-1255(+)
MAVIENFRRIAQQLLGLRIASLTAETIAQLREQRRVLEGPRGAGVVKDALRALEEGHRRRESAPKVLGLGGGPQSRSEFPASDPSGAQGAGGLPLDTRGHRLGDLPDQLGCLFVEALPVPQIRHVPQQRHVPQRPFCARTFKSSLCRLQDGLRTLPVRRRHEEVRSEKACVAEAAAGADLVLGVGRRSRHAPPLQLCDDLAVHIRA